MKKTWIGVNCRRTIEKNEDGTWSMYIYRYKGRKAVRTWNFRVDGNKFTAIDRHWKFATTFNLPESEWYDFFDGKMEAHCIVNDTMDYFAEWVRYSMSCPPCDTALRRGAAILTAQRLLLDVEYFQLSTKEINAITDHFYNYEDECKGIGEDWGDFEYLRMLMLFGLSK